LTNPHVIHAARLELTPAQFEAWNLSLQGYGTRWIALQLNISRAAAIDRLDAAALKLRKAGIWQDATGNWHHTPKETAA
jgi:hypothetical protein